MSFVDFGSWGPAEPVEVDGVVFARYQNAQGDDWYETVAHRADRPTGLALCLNDAGKPVFSGDDLNQLHPANSRVILLPGWSGSSADRAALFDKVFDFATGSFVDLAPTVPAFVTRAQALMALHKAGLLPSVKDAVAVHPLEEVRIWFDNAGTWLRENPYVLALAAELGLSAQQVDALFLAAAKEGS